MGDAMKRSLRVLGAATLMSCLPCASFANGPTTPSSPPSMSVISYKMGGVAGDLAKKETGEPVQNQEKRIVRDLDELIAALEKECENCKGNRAPNNPKKPAATIDDPRRHGRHRRPGRPHGKRERLGQAVGPRA